MQPLAVGDIALLVGQTGAFSLSFAQWIKRFGWFKNDWCEIITPLIGLLFGVGWWLASTHDFLGIYQVFGASWASGNLGAGTLYQAQKPLGLLPSGPDNYRPVDKPTPVPPGALGGGLH